VHCALYCALYWHCTCAVLCTVYSVQGQHSAPPPGSALCPYQSHLEVYDGGLDGVCCGRTRNSWPPLATSSHPECSVSKAGRGHRRRRKRRHVGRCTQGDTQIELAPLGHVLALLRGARVGQGRGHRRRAQRQEDDSERYAGRDRGCRRGALQQLVSCTGARGRWQWPLP